MTFQISRLPAGVPEREIAEEESGDGGVLDNVARAAHHHRGDAVCLEVACGQTHGLVTNRSGRNQDRCIYAVLAAHVEYLWGVAFRRKALAAERGYRVEPAVDLTNSAIGGPFL